MNFKQPVINEDRSIILKSKTKIEIVCSRLVRPKAEVELVGPRISVSGPKPAIIGSENDEFVTPDADLTNEGQKKTRWPPPLPTR